MVYNFRTTVEKWRNYGTNKGSNHYARVNKQAYTINLWRQGAILTLDPFFVNNPHNLDKQGYLSLGQ